MSLRPQYGSHPWRIAREAKCSTSNEMSWEKRNRSKREYYTQRGHNLRKPVRWPSEAVALGWRFSTASEGHRTKPQFVTACSILPYAPDRT